ncbi:MAG TPA: PEP-CTERM system histidine kinase PrsK [Rhodocyclaceae bacterium]|jgi:putative PEP-CTERM system histidine kinase|nr:PEP-CTERM system histidine kinase PrsK [Rhodocyclaceae bacterium]HMV20765.1 PEP-CTERM system histidine kinase PrsK [Rhodocyclaceae bacterium]HMW76531.1 PEP-CTERM system histidine kinase PrsK [Rhodocyclaceae bacterium]HNE42147.1 PEP-CTERM system histidine kinase PrsK [Rhodocyclaceae bacterium]HNL20523.1 PEP-CTERM system histidine kinase PrsK [Rhodocyclaceae bacterium]
MDRSLTTVILLSFGLAAVSYGILAAFLAFVARSSEMGRRAGAMLVAVGLSALWAVFGAAFAATGQPFFWLAGAIADVLRYGGWYVFLLLVCRAPNRNPGSERVFVKLALLAGALVVSGVLIQLAPPLGWIAAEALQRIHLIHAVGMIVFSLVLLEQLFRNTAADSLWNIKPLCLGLLGVWVYDLYMYSDALLFNRLDVDAYSIRGYVYAAVVPLLAVSTSRSRDWVAKIRLSQKAAFHSASLLFAGVYLLFMAAVGYYVRYFGGEWGRALQIALVFAAIMVLGVLAVSGAMRAKLRVIVGKHFFRYRYDYRDEWLKFTHTLSAQESPQAMYLQVIRGLADMLESPAGSLWLREPSRLLFTQSARWNLAGVQAVEPADSSFCTFLRESGWVVNLEEYRCYAKRYEGLQLPEWISEIPNAWLVVPLVIGEDLIGFVVLGSARTAVDVNWEVNDLLKTAGRQAASFLAQMQATEALLEARKFDAFNRMSAFVVHDLKNIVTQLSLMIRNAERHRDNPEFQSDMLMTVEHAVERMRQLMLQLREGATPPGTPVGVELEPLLQRILRAKRSQGRELELEISENLTTRGQEERLERVVGHLVQNSLDATEVPGRVWVKLQKQGGLARIEVGDNGAGMTQEFIRERLFKPFQTTKQAGMGIGAYESSQYVQELGGKILVDSKVGEGTTVTLLLPLFDVSSRSDLRQEAA